MALEKTLDRSKSFLEFFDLVTCVSFQLQEMTKVFLGFMEVHGPLNGVPGIYGSPTGASGIYAVPD